MRENITEADNSNNNNHFQKDNKKSCHDYRIINYNIQNIQSSFFGIITYSGQQPPLLQRSGTGVRNTARPLPLRKTKGSADEHTCLKQVLNSSMFQWPKNIYTSESMTTEIIIKGLT
jgi:hypothetical protein